MLILALCSLVLPGRAFMPNEADSLSHLLEKLPHDTKRLATLRQLIQTKQLTPQGLVYADMLDKEAKAQKNDLYRTYAAYQKTIYYYSQNNQDSVDKWVKFMEPFARKADNMDLYFDAQRLQIDLYSLHEKFELAINEALKMRKQAEDINSIRGLIVSNQAIANAYLSTNRWQQGMEILEETYSLLPLIDHPATHISVLSQLLLAAEDSHDSKSLIKYLREQEKALKEYTGKNPVQKKTLSNWYLLNRIYYTHYYLSTGQKELAYEYLKKAGKHLDENTYFVHRMHYHNAYAAYYRACKEYDKALAQVDTTLLCLKKEQTNLRIHQQSVKADILLEAGQSREAYELYLQAFNAKDSVNTSISDKQMAQIKESFNIDKLKLQREELKSEIQTAALIIIAIIMVILLVFIVRVTRVRKALRISEQNTREANRIAQEANEMKSRFLSNMSYNIRIPLNGVVGFSQLIATEEEICEATRKEYSDIIQNKSQELMRLVNDVLDLSRLEAGMMKFQIQEYDVLGLCNETLFMANRQNQNSIEIRFKHNIDRATNITSDTGRLTQALLSALTYPRPEKEFRKITFLVTLNMNIAEAEFRILNSPLADKAFHSQEVSIRHEINRLLLKHFGGTYTYLEDAPEGPMIVFTYPLKLI